MTEATTENSKQKLWYIRRKSQIKGPFPSGALRRFVMMGRVMLSDEVSTDKEQWDLVSNVPEVVPPEVRKAAENGTLDELIPARMREDERTGRDRRNADADAEILQRRKGERRQDEPEVAKRHRAAKTDLRELQSSRKIPVAGAAVIGALVTVVIGYGLYIGTPPDIPDPDCTASPAPGINWRNCRLDGLQAETSDLSGALVNNAVLRGAKLSGSRISDGDLQYVDFSGSDLSYADLSNSLLKGAGLRKTDLSYADLTNADLSFADLSGANLGGAMLAGTILENAIWTDGSRCAPGSVGHCLPQAKR
jgi:hypothetical protein